MKKVILLAAFAAASYGQTPYYTWTTECDTQPFSWSGNLIFSGSPGCYSGWMATSPPSSNTFRGFSTAVPPGSGSEYEISTGFYHYGGWNSWGPVEYIHYLQATTNASLRGNIGTFYAASLTRPGSGNWTLNIYKRKDNVLTVLSTANTGCPSHMIGLRSLTRASGDYPGITVIVTCESGWGVPPKRYFVADTSIASGSAGIEVYDTPIAGVTPGSLIKTVTFYASDRIAPNAVDSGSTAISRFSDRVELQWKATTDNTGGSGVRAYQIWRDGLMLIETTDLAYVDYGGNSATTSYTYGIRAIDNHGNAGPLTVLPMPSLSTSAPTDPRQTGIRPTGSYWGALGEQIDMRSGNLNYSVPLITAKSRNGASVSFGLNYNSQLWRQDGTSTFKLGADVGYGFGWKLLAGSIIPVWIDQYTIGHYLYTDSTGAEYKLDTREGDTWSTSNEDVYLWYNTVAKKLYFGDGSFWLMDCLSADTADTGTRYPTLMQDRNGNQVVIRYQPSVGGTTDNTSARIKEIEDVRAADQGGGAYRTYAFTYNTDSPPHLTAITNTIGTSEAYTFTYSPPQALYGPFTPQQQFGNTQILQTLTVSGLNVSHAFEYSTAGEMSKVTFPYGADFRYQYQSFTFINGQGGNRTIREVSTRQFTKATGATTVSYPITRDSSDSSRLMHSMAAIADPSGIGHRTWMFSTAADWTRGLRTRLDVRNASGGAVLLRDDITWAKNLKGHPYAATSKSTADPGQTYEKVSKSDQTIDIFGNVTEAKQYTYVNLTTPARTQTCTYTSYLLQYSFRLPVSCSITNGTQTVTLFTASYDTQALTIANPVPRLLDTTVAAQRGNQTSLVTPYVTYTVKYTNFGGVATAQDSTGKRVDTQYDAARNLAVPNIVTPNSNANLNQTMSWNAYLGLTGQTQANMYSTSFTYDAYARPASATNSDAGVTYFSYTTSPPTKTATTQPGTVYRYDKTYYDGLGRTIKTQVSTSDNVIQSVTETEYDSCACSPVGKLKRASQPYKPGDPVYWTTYSYDGLGRTTSVSLPGSAGSTTYLYQGNTVTTTDPSGRWKKFTSDAFGNLVQVNEPNPAGGADLITTYTYNFRDKLATVSMIRGSVTQTRTFTYDNLTQERLVQTVFPETGTTSYVYNVLGQVTSKTDAKNQTTVYEYDSYGRITRNGNIYYGYDTAQVINSIGQVVGTAYGVPSGASQIGGFSESYQYSQSGRLVTKQLAAGGLILKMTQAWDYWGNIMRIEYPITPTFAATTWDVGNPVNQEQYRISYSREKLGRLGNVGAQLQINGNTYGYQIGYASDYNAAGQLTQFNWWNGTAYVAENRTYNALNQLTRITHPGEIDVEYRYSTTANDGRITSQKNWISGEEVQYQYDTLARLTSAETVGPQWGQSFSYDGFGNLLSKAITKGTATTMNLLVDGTTNRITTSGFQYDATGNMTQMPFGGGSQTMTYDVYGRTASIVNSNGTETYTYDHQNRRITKTKNGVTDIYFYAPSGQLLGRYRAKSYSTPDGQLTITGPQCQEMYFYAGSRLAYIRPGSVFGLGARVNTDRLSSTGDGSRYLPYGEERTVTAQDTFKFATYYRDSQSSLDYAQNRYYSSTHGRFTSPDPFVGSANPGNPQSWNRYSYVGNDPINKNDPTGLFELPSIEAWHTEYIPSWCMTVPGYVPWSFCRIQQLPPDDYFTIVAIPGVAFNSLTGFDYDLTEWDVVVPAAITRLGEDGLIYGDTYANGFVAGAIIRGKPLLDKILEKYGPVIAAGIGVIWEMGKHRLQWWDVDCHIHIIGTPNHEVAEKKTWTVLAFDASSARDLAMNLNDVYVQENYRSRGVPAHTQHCINERLH